MADRFGVDDARTSREVQKVAARAIRRLDILEWFILGAAGLLALVAGGLMAIVGQALLGLPFRPTWMVASLVLFVVPGLIARRRARRLDGDSDAAGEAG